MIPCLKNLTAKAKLEINNIRNNSPNIKNIAKNSPGAFSQSAQHGSQDKPQIHLSGNVAYGNRLGGIYIEIGEDTILDFQDNQTFNNGGHGTVIKVHPKKSKNKK